MLPAWGNVFSPFGVRVQESDGWYHARSIQNLAAHYPWRSAFDSYALHPDGQRVVTGPFWDHLCALAAWLVGFGQPSLETVEIITAWMPALFGATLPWMAYLLASSLAGVGAGLWSAWWVAVLPGGMLWQTHLGLPDHHGAECLLALATLAALHRGSWVWTGLALGCVLLNRPAAVFVPGTLALAVLFAPSLATLLLRAAALATVLVLPAWGTYQLQYSVLALCCLALAAAVATLRWRWWIAGVSGVALIVGLAIFWPDAIRMPLRYLNPSRARIESMVQELVPLFRIAPLPPSRILLSQFGSAWVLALPALVFVLWRSAQREAWRTFALWSTVMMIGAFLQARMVTYAALPIAMLAAFACHYAVRRARWLALPAVAALAFNVLPSIQQAAVDMGPSMDWMAALDWLKRNTPEPFGNQNTWLALQDKPFSSAGYGVGVWWDHGYWVQYLGRRVPTANGTQVNASEMARILLSGDGKVGGPASLRYLMVDSSLCAFPNVPAHRFASMGILAGIDGGTFARKLHDRSLGESRTVYLPGYYRTLVARLFLHDGKAHPGTGVSLWRVGRRDRGGEEILESLTFASEQLANEYIEQHPEGSFVLGCTDARVSCVPLEAVANASLVYSSAPTRDQATSILHPLNLHAVKVFEVLR